jgi:hypothetical protein
MTARRYRKRADVVEAVQFDGANFPELAEFAEVTTYGGGDCFLITSEGLVGVRVGEWLVRDGEGEVSVCTQASFEANYEGA